MMIKDIITALNTVEDKNITVSIDGEKPVEGIKITHVYSGKDEVDSYVEIY